MKWLKEKYCGRVFIDVVDGQEECRYISDVVWNEKRNKSAYNVITNFYKTQDRKPENEANYAINGYLLDMIDTADRRLGKAAVSDIATTSDPTQMLDESEEVSIHVSRLSFLHFCRHNELFMQTKMNPDDLRLQSLKDKYVGRIFVDTDADGKGKEECRIVTDVVWFEGIYNTYVVETILYKRHRLMKKDFAEYGIDGTLLDMIDTASGRLMSREDAQE